MRQRVHQLRYFRLFSPIFLPSWSNRIAQVGGIMEGAEFPWESSILSPLLILSQRGKGRESVRKWESVIHSIRGETCSSSPSHTKEGSGRSLDSSLSDSSFGYSQPNSVPFSALISFHLSSLLIVTFEVQTDEERHRPSSSLVTRTIEW